MGKQRGRQGPERRRGLAEINLAASQKPSGTARVRKGCLHLFGTLTLVLCVSAAVAAVVR